MKISQSSEGEAFGCIRTCLKGDKECFILENGEICSMGFEVSWNMTGN